MENGRGAAGGERSLFPSEVLCGDFKQHFYQKKSLARPKKTISSKRKCPVQGAGNSPKLFKNPLRNISNFASKVPKFGQNGPKNPIFTTNRHRKEAKILVVSDSYGGGRNPENASAIRFLLFFAEKRRGAAAAAFAGRRRTQSARISSLKKKSKEILFSSSSSSPPKKN